MREAVDGRMFIKIWRWLFSVGMIVAGPFHVTNGVSNLYVATASAQWPNVSATIVSSRVVEYRGRGVGYGPEIEYQYIVDGRRYTGHNIWLMDSALGKVESEAVVAQFPAGAVVQARYDETDPGRAVLRAERNDFTWTTATVGFIGFCLGIYVCPALGVSEAVARRYPSLDLWRRGDA
jgi:hypothetical protein